MRYKDIWTEREETMISIVFDCLEKNSMVDVYRQLHESLVALEYQAVALSLYPSILQSNRLGGKERNLETLVAILSEKYRDEDMFVMPSRAILSRSYEVCKVNTLYMINHVLDILRDKGIVVESEKPMEFVCSRMLSIMTEDVLLSLLSDPTRMDVKPYAVNALVGIWEDRVSAESIAFHPELRNMWKLRQTSVPVFGCMTGTHEYFSLCKRANDICLEYILYSTEISDEASALEEFLFGLNYEELCTIRTHLNSTGKSCIDRNDVTKLLMHDKIYFGENTDDPMELYRFFNHRRKKAYTRSCKGFDGPVRTFEENFMAFLLMKDKKKETKTVQSVQFN